MFPKCPGQDGRKIVAEEIACSNCGYRIEFFSDEIKSRCPKCKKILFKERLPSCFEWCKSARECLGEQKWKQLNGK